jgi:ParB-like nuclease domain
MKPNGKIHPITELFPMMPEEELNDLAESIKSVGLLNPIVLDDDGTLIDGRNRLEACKRAGVEPEFTGLNGQDPIRLIFGENASRRHMTKGQLAMVAVKAEVSKLETSEFKRGTTRRLARLGGVNEQRISEAKLVYDHAPAWVDSVISGAKPLHEALEEAKRQQGLVSSAEHQMKVLREEAPDLADLVVEERITLKEARAALDQRKEDDLRERQQATTSLCTTLSYLDPRAMDVGKLASDYVSKFEPKYASEEISKKRISKCIEVLNEIAKQWKD